MGAFGPRRKPTLALWDKLQGSQPPRVEASALCITVTIGGLIAAAVALKGPLAVLF